MNVKCAAESVFDRSLVWSGKTFWVRRAVWCVWFVCVRMNARPCHLIAVGESGETGNYPSLQLIHFILRLGSGEQSNLRVCQTHRHIHTHTQKMRAYDACWTDLWFWIMSTLHLPLAPAATVRVGTGSIFRLSWCLVPTSSFSLSFSLQPSGRRGSSFFTEND